MLKIVSSQNVCLVRTACSSLGRTVVCRREEARRSQRPVGQRIEISDGRCSREIADQPSGWFVFQAAEDRVEGDIDQVWNVACSRSDLAG